MKVYVAVYSNHFIEEWEVLGVFADKTKAQEFIEDQKRSDVWDRFQVETHEVQK